MITVNVIMTYIWSFNIFPLWPLYWYIMCVQPGLQYKNRLWAPPSHSCRVWMAAHMCAAYSYHPAWQVEKNIHATHNHAWKNLSIMLFVVYWCHSVFVCSDGNLATKQVVFLQRPVRSQEAGQLRNKVGWNKVTKVPFTHVLWLWTYPEFSQRCCTCKHKCYH